jgi:hypothetical protein
MVASVPLRRNARLEPALDRNVGSSCMTTAGIDVAGSRCAIAFSERGEASELISEGTPLSESSRQRVKKAARD